MARETADTLDQEADNEPEIPEALKAVKLTVKLTVQQSVSRRKGKGESRAVRLENACSYLQAVIGHLENGKDDPTDEQQELLDHLQNTVDTVEGVEFPGVYG